MIYNTYRAMFPYWDDWIPRYTNKGIDKQHQRRMLRSGIYIVLPILLIALMGLYKLMN